jgi:hypothetical protein
MICLEEMRPDRFALEERDEIRCGLVSARLVANFKENAQGEEIEE